MEVKDWVLIASAGATFLLAVAAFWAIKEQHKDRKEERRNLALERIRRWAEDTFDIISRPSPTQELKEILLILKLNLRIVHVKSVGILSDAEQLRGEVASRVKTGYLELSKFIAMLGGENDIADLKEYFRLTDFGNITPIRNTEQLAAAKKDVMHQLLGIIDTATKILVPKK